MVQLQSIILSIFVVLYSNTWAHQYILYNTDLMSTSFSHDCLYYTIKKNANVDDKEYKLRQTIEYCIRLPSNKNDPMVKGAISSISAFDQLKKKHVSVKNLIEWSAPMDLIERYQNYLQTDNLLSIDYFANCTTPWFGPSCQYKFYLNESFSDIVSWTFRRKTHPNYRKLLTCYIYLECNRGPAPICLDWREICDGKIDCLDTGEDEKYCFELEINQCAENEYQCRNGMCVNEAFALDGNTKIYSPECLDGSDEIERQRTGICEQDPGFQCEDTACLSPFYLTCGDGKCISWPIEEQGSVCVSSRALVFDILVDWHIHQMTPYVRCWKIITCLSKIIRTLFGKNCRSVCENIEECEIRIRQYCLSLFISHDLSMWDNPERFNYFDNQTLNHNFSMRDTFICYNYHQCPFLTLNPHLSNATCLSIYRLVWPLPQELHNGFVSCVRLYQGSNKTHCSESSMLRCWGMNKCIPKRYILDGIWDCYGGFDESLSANSCELNDNTRFQCTSERKCLSPVLVDDNFKQCLGGEDELDTQARFSDIEKLPFSALCDGWTDLFSSENETDETHCERWPCVNQYTRCNGVWNCPKGIDELNCPFQFQCPIDHHPCISSTNYTMDCLHVNRTDDEIIDCLGATDERTHCRLQYPDDNARRYRCWNDTTCVLIGQGCDKCGKIDQIERLCDASYDDYYNANDYLEFTSDLEFHRKQPFSVQSSPRFPERQLKSIVDKYSLHQKTQLGQFQSNEWIEDDRLWVCNRGILIFVGENETEQCLCPPSYYGYFCEYQNQRVVLTLRLDKKSLTTFDIIGVIITLVDHTGFIHSYEQFTYIPTHDCNKKFIVYLLYQDQPKDKNKNYTVYIDAYHKVTFLLLNSWLLPVQFPFMPVNRMSAQLTVSARSECSVSCDQKFRQSTESCQCSPDSSRKTSTFSYRCNCSWDSICVGWANNRSICLCLLTKLGPRCLLESVCQTTRCMNGGLCVPNDVGSFLEDFTCVCQEGFSGEICEKNDTKIDISFIDVTIPQSVLAHFIITLAEDLFSQNPSPIRLTTLKKIPLDQDTVTFYMSLPFDILFVQIEDTYYLTVLQLNNTSSVLIPTQIMPSQRCPHIRKLLDEETVGYPTLRRVKYYHIPCSERIDLVCFHDNETFMCLCTKDRHANCFHFNFNFTYDCYGLSDCENRGKCYQNHPRCPSKTMCVCEECFYGTKCQLSTKGFGLSLDAILGYQIHPYRRISRQSVSVKVSISVAILMLTAGLINGILSILTFWNKSIRDIGCGLYLFASSINSILIVLILNLKVWLLILSQMSVITSRSFLLVNCISIDFVLRSVVAITDWFFACVAVERMITVILDVTFNKTKSKCAAKFVIPLVPILTIASMIHDPIHRHLIDDEDEKRTWCIVRYPSSFEIFNSVINIFHFIIPFSLNVISPIGIIFIGSRRRALAKKQQTYKQHLKEQFRHHYHLFVSSTALIILALPRLIISLTSGCMKSARNPALFLAGYFVPFIPSLLIFIIFILPSQTYKKEFMTTMKRIRRILRQYFNFL